jgi:hypothetical protein
MDRKQKVVFVAGLFICAMVAIFVPDGIYYALILLVIMVALLLSLQIMQETTSFPDVTCGLQPDSKGIVVRNRGNAKAVAIHLALVPLDLEFDVPPLEPEETATLAVPRMISEAKAAITYENSAGGKYSRTVMLSATGMSDEDLLKPMFPLHGWK